MAASCQQLVLVGYTKNGWLYSVDYLKMSNPGLIVTILWMFIGGTSGSTAGGLKTTTFGVLFLQFRAILKGNSEWNSMNAQFLSSSAQAFTLFFLATFYV